MSYIHSIEDISVKTLEKMEMYSDDAVSMVMRTGFAETGFRHLKQMGDGPAIGFFQSEPNTIKDIWVNYALYRPNVRDCLLTLGYDEPDIEYRVMSNIALQVAFCRLQYRRDRYAIPSTDDIEGQAKYWKRVYNTKLGKGTIEHFIKANKDYEPAIGV